MERCLLPDTNKKTCEPYFNEPVLTLLAERVPWEAYRPILERGYSCARKSKAGRKRIDPVVLFKMLILKRLYGLSDKQLEFQAKHSPYLESFIGISKIRSAPDATTVSFFRERLKAAGIINELFLLFEQHLLELELTERCDKLINSANATQQNPSALVDHSC